MYWPPESTLAIAVWSTSLPLGGAAGPLIGGAMLQVFWWGAVFLLGLPVMLLLGVGAGVGLPALMTLAMAACAHGDGDLTVLVDGDRGGTPARIATHTASPRRISRFRCSLI